MKVIVTGGHGFIGGHLVKSLEARGDYAFIVDLKSSSSHDVATAAPHYWQGFDLIYHLAAVSRIPPSYANPAETVRVNVGGTLNIIRQARCPVVLASTTNEGRSPYTVSKRAAELLMRPGDSILQIANVYGPGGTGVVDQFKAADVLRIQGGCQRKDFVHVDDVVNALLSIKPGTTCICSERLVSIDELAAMTGKPVERLPEAPGECTQRERKSDYLTTWRVEDYLKAREG